MSEAEEVKKAQEAQPEADRLIERIQDAIPAALESARSSESKDVRIDGEGKIYWRFWAGMLFDDGSTRIAFTSYDSIGNPQKKDAPLEWFSDIPYLCKIYDTFAKELIIGLKNYLTVIRNF